MTTSGYPISDSCECLDCEDLREQEEMFEKYDLLDYELPPGQWWLTSALERVRENRLKAEGTGS